MGMIASEPFESETRTADPDNTSSVDMQAKGVKKVIATLQVTANSGGSADQTLDVKAQDSDNGSDWRDLEEGTFEQVNQNYPIPHRSTIQFVPKRQYLRWTAAHGGTTKSATWQLGTVYHT